MSYCEAKLKELKEKPKSEWTEDDFEDYYYCKSVVVSAHFEEAELNGEED